MQIISLYPTFLIKNVLFYTFDNQPCIILYNSIKQFHCWYIVPMLMPQSAPHSHYVNSKQFQTKSPVMDSVVFNRV